MNMLDMKKLFFLVVGATFLHALEAKIDCSLVRCARPVGCEGGTIKPPGGCCDVCLKQKGEACGGLSNVHGICDNGLYCKTSVYTSIGVCACPVFKCAACPNGYVIGPNGCQTCICKPKVCGISSCSLIKCAYGVVSYIDKNGCKQCRCRACGISSCLFIKCAHGSISYVDKNGCKQCKCRVCPPVCKKLCLYGNVVDRYGCKLCQCNPKPCGISSCLFIKCAHGSISYIDKNGCKQCKCRICPPVCKKLCLYGNVVDKYGCKLCQCKPKPCGISSCLLIKCAHGSISYIDKNGCKQCKCRVCPPVCKKFCMYGNVVNKYGCKLCQCKPKPCGISTCLFIKCAHGSIPYFDQNGCKQCKCSICPPVCEKLCLYGNVVDKYGCKLCQCKPKPAGTCPLFPAPPPDKSLKLCGFNIPCPADECNSNQDCTPPKLCCVSGGVQGSPRKCLNPVPLPIGK